MGIYKARLTRKEVVARDTIALYFTKTEGFSYVAGQFLRLTLIHMQETDPRGNFRYFSIASAPFENEVCIATRLRDTAFKHALENVPSDYEVEIQGPFGKFILDDTESVPAVFLAGGIGITPFRSMLAQGIQTGLQRQIFLFYANKKMEDAAFFTEISIWAKMNSNFIFIPIMTQEDNTSWQGEIGHITENTLRKYLQEVKRYVYYIAGPPEMVSSIKEVLAPLGTQENQIKVENFTGY